MESGLCCHPGGLRDVGVMWQFPRALSLTRVRFFALPHNLRHGRNRRSRAKTELDGDPGPQNAVAVATNPPEDDPDAH